MSTNLGNVLARMAECAFELKKLDDVPVLATASKIWSQLTLSSTAMGMLLET